MNSMLSFLGTSGSIERVCSIVSAFLSCAGNGKSSNAVVFVLMTVGMGQKEVLNHVLSKAQKEVLNHVLSKAHSGKKLSVIRKSLLRDEVPQCLYIADRAGTIDVQS